MKNRVWTIGKRKLKQENKKYYRLDVRGNSRSDENKIQQIQKKVRWVKNQEM